MLVIIYTGSKVVEAFAYKVFPELMYFQLLQATIFAC